MASMTLDALHLRRRAWLLTVLIGIAAVGPARAVDLTGRWRVEGGTPSPAFVVITQTGDTVAIPTDGFSATAGQLQGTIAAPGDFDLVGVGPCTPFEFRGRLLPGERVMHGTFATLCPSLELRSVVFTRCGCSDGNAADGDGCDATCQVEPCFTCSGEPSACAPVADGGSCDDRRDCTVGESCAAGVCGNGSPVSPCVDVTGTWAVHDELDGFTPSMPLDYTVPLFQRDGLVRWNDYLGPIDLATGAFTLGAPDAGFFFGGAAFLPLTGVAGAATLSGNGFRFVGTRTPFPTVVTGVRLGPAGCGDGIVGITEICDDGNTVAGDGCSPTCSVEPCFACAGSPSTCGPRTSCRRSTTPERAVLKIDDRSPGDRDALSWKWPRGDALAIAELGNPLAGDDYTLCLFDESSGTPELLLAVVAPEGGTCAGRPCWTALKQSGFRYKDREATPDGLTSIAVKRGEAGKSQAAVEAKGALLEPPIVPLPLPLRVQLQVENGACLVARYEASGVLDNDPARGMFKARAAAAP